MTPSLCAAILRGIFSCPDFAADPELGPQFSFPPVTEADKVGFLPARIIDFGSVIYPEGS
jgi:hypothetical protein